VRYQRDTSDLPNTDDPARVVLQCTLDHPLGEGYVGISVLERLVQGAAGGETPNRELRIAEVK
jgi:hypothetical protein